MLRRICGFDSVREIPAESNFSEAFAEFARTDVMSKIHETMIELTFKDVVVGHIRRDATEIHAREKIAHPGKRNPRSKKIPAGYKRERPRKDDPRSINKVKNWHIT